MVASVRNRNWCLTVWTEPEEFKHEHVTYIVCGGREECPETGKEHWHIYVEFSRAIRLRPLKRMFGGDSVHAEGRCGNPDEAFVYATKNGILWESGRRSRVRQGRRNDLTAVNALIQEGASWDEVNAEHPAVCARYGRYIEKCMDSHLKKISRDWRPQEIIVYWGTTGLGKSRRAFDEARAFEGGWYNLPIQQGASTWFDGYMGEPLLVIDEYRGGIPFAIFLRLLDGHPVTVPKKGGHTYACWKRVLITSNLDPATWYPLQDEGSQLALRRRFTSVLHFDSL